MQTYLYIALSAIALASILYLSDLHDRELNRIADCVVEQAYMQDYAGNAYSREAWDLFAPSCK